MLFIEELIADNIQYFGILKEGLRTGDKVYSKKK